MLGPLWRGYSARCLRRTNHSYPNFQIASGTLSSNVLKAGKHEGARLSLQDKNTPTATARHETRKGETLAQLQQQQTALEALKTQCKATPITSNSKIFHPTNASTNSAPGASTSSTLSNTSH